MNPSVSTCLFDLRMLKGLHGSVHVKPGMVVTLKNVKFFRGKLTHASRVNIFHYVINTINNLNHNIT